MRSSNIKKCEQLLTLAYQDYQQSLTRHTFAKINNHARGEELVQDTFMKTWKYLLKGGKIEKMRAFLYHTLNHLIIDEYRRQKTTTSLDVLMDAGFEVSEDNSARLFNMIDGRKAAQLIKQLPLTYRKNLRMRYLQGLSIKEVSDLTGKSENTISVQTHRGLDALKKLYAHEQ